MHPPKLFALDLGTTKFALAALTTSARDGARIKIFSVPAAGMKRGMLSDFALARVALNTLLDVVERQLRTRVDRVSVGIAGSHLRGRVAPSSLSVSSKPITPECVSKLIFQAETENIEEHREPLHVVPLSYRIDGRQDINSPIGFSGSTLSGRFFIIDADKHYLRDVVTLVNSVGLQVATLVAEPFASASVTLSEDQKEFGVVLADIGGGTTDGIAFFSGKPCALFTVNVAGHLMTNDLAIGLGTSLQDAEQLKIRYGLQRPNASAAAGQTSGVGHRDIFPILAPRVLELGSLINRSVNPIRHLLSRGIVLTGGASEVTAMPEFLGKHLSCLVSRAAPRLPESIAIDAAADKSSKFATVLGMLNLGLGTTRIQGPSPDRKTATPKYLSHFVNWLKELA